MLNCTKASIDNLISSFYLASTWGDFVFYIAFSSIHNMNMGILNMYAPAGF